MDKIWLLVLASVLGATQSKRGTTKSKILTQQPLEIINIQAPLATTRRWLGPIRMPLAVGTRFAVPAGHPFTPAITGHLVII